MIAIMLNPFLRSSAEPTMGPPVLFFSAILVWVVACCYAMDYFGSSTPRRFDDAFRQRRAWGALVITLTPLLFLWFLYVKHVILHIK